MGRLKESERQRDVDRDKERQRQREREREREREGEGGREAPMDLIISHLKRFIFIESENLNSYLYFYKHQSV